MIDEILKTIADNSTHSFIEYCGSLDILVISVDYAAKANSSLTDIVFLLTRGCKETNF